MSLLRPWEDNPNDPEDVEQTVKPESFNHRQVYTKGQGHGLSSSASFSSYEHSKQTACRETSKPYDRPPAIPSYSFPVRANRYDEADRSRHPLAPYTHSVVNNLQSINDYEPYFEDMTQIMSAGELHLNGSQLQSHFREQQEHQHIHDTRPSLQERPQYVQISSHENTESIGENTVYNEVKHRRKSDPNHYTGNSTRNSKGAPFLFSEAMGQWVNMVGLRGMRGIKRPQTSQEEASTATEVRQDSSSFDASTISQNSNVEGNEIIKKRIREKEIFNTAIEPKPSKRLENSARECCEKCADPLRHHAEVLARMQGAPDVDGGMKKRMNKYMSDVLFSPENQMLYHPDCVTFVLDLTNNALKRLAERKMKENHVSVVHGLVGRRSNNSKSPETLQRFIDFVKANRSEMVFMEGEKPQMDGDVEIRYYLKSSVIRLQGDGEGTLRTKFNLSQQSGGENGETISGGTAQAWFKKYFRDTLKGVQATQYIIHRMPQDLKPKS
eukprot:CFRG6457T1